MNWWQTSEEGLQYGQTNSIKHVPVLLSKYKGWYIKDEKRVDTYCSNAEKELLYWQNRIAGKKFVTNYALVIHTTLTPIWHWVRSNHSYTIDMTNLHLHLSHLFNIINITHRLRTHKLLIAQFCMMHVQQFTPPDHLMMIALHTVIPGHSTAMSCYH